MASLRTLLSVGILLLATSLAHGFAHKRVCYFTVSASASGMTFLPENINATLCTHIIYAFVPIADISLAKDARTANATVSGMIKRTKPLKAINPNLKIMVAIGGHSAATKDVAVISRQRKTRSRFARNCVAFLRSHDIDGLDLSFEHPKSGPGSSIPRNQFSLLVKALRRAFKIDEIRTKRTMLLLSASVDPRKEVVDTAYNVKYIAKMLDWISVNAFDLLRPAGRTIQHHAALFRSAKIPKQDKQLTAAWVLNYWAHKGVPKAKLLFGLSAHGRVFKLVSDTKHRIGDPRGKAKPRFLSYAGVCYFGGKIVWHIQMKVPYAYNAHSWVGFDDPKSMSIKVRWLKKNGFGGFSFSSLNLDDFAGAACHKEAFPLLTAATRVLERRPVIHAGHVSISVKQASSPSRSANVSQAQVDSAPKNRQKRQSDGVIYENDDAFTKVCFFNADTRNRLSGVKFVPEDIDTDMCTQIVLGYASLSGLKIVPMYAGATSIGEGVKGTYEQVTKLKEDAPELKVLIGIGGWDLVDNKLNAVLKNDELLLFKTNVMEFLRKHAFDGIHLDLTYASNPGFKWTSSGILNFTTALSDLFQSTGGVNEETAGDEEDKPLLTASVSARGNIKEIYGDIAKLIENFAWVAIVAREFDTVPNTATRHSWALKSGEDDDENDVKRTMSNVSQLWEEEGCPKEKLIVGLSSYGRSYYLRDPANHGLGAPVLQKSTAGDLFGEPGILTYYEICKLLTEGGTEVWDDDRKVPYMWLENQWVSYENVQSIQEKVKWLVTVGYKGYYFETLDFDDFSGSFCQAQTNYPLLEAASNEINQEANTTVDFTNDEYYDGEDDISDVGDGGDVYGSGEGDYYEGEDLGDGSGEGDYYEGEVLGDGSGEGDYYEGEDLGDGSGEADYYEGEDLVDGSGEGDYTEGESLDYGSDEYDYGYEGA